ncbi:hypothetical protein AGMMS4952_10210 [Spirochaetia bacterium]|nr:hypothetical protein AGMMS4952_10210 [Spirochaetia bacterium]
MQNGKFSITIFYYFAEKTVKKGRCLAPLETYPGMLYADPMTLTVRNNYFRSGIVLSLLALVTILSLSFIIFSAYPPAGAAATRSAGLFQPLISRFFTAHPYVPFVTMLGSVLYAFITMILIYYFFEKTQSPEILFFALFVTSFAFEALRVMVPLVLVYNLPSVYLVMSTRVLLIARYFGLFSLLAASIYAAGLGEQKQGNIIFIIVIAAMIVALGVPVDSLAWDSSLMMVSGYTSMLKIVEAGIALIAAVSFFISAYSRGSNEYIFIGIGSLLAFLGRLTLLSADTWITPLPGMVLLAAGTWIICVQLHRVYLWL